MLKFIFPAPTSMKTLFSFVCCVFSLTLMGQASNGSSFSLENNLHYSLNSSGNSSSNKNGAVSFSYGQVFYDSYATQKHNVTEGIQQTNQYSRQINPALPAPEVVSIKVSPNPMTSFVTVNIPELEDNLSYQFYSLKGNLIESGPLVSTETEINAVGLENALYLLKVSQNGKTLKIFRLIKK